MNPAISARLKILQIVVAVLTSTVFIYLYLGATFVKANLASGGLNQSLNHPIAKMLAMVSIAILIVAYFLPLLILKATLKSQNLKTPDSIFAAYFVSVILRCALVEPIAVFGLIVSHFSIDMDYTYVASFIALFGLWLSFPSEERFQQLLTRMQ